MTGSISFFVLMVIYLIGYVTLGFLVTSRRQIQKRSMSVFSSVNEAKSELIEILMAKCDEFREEQKKQWDLTSLSSTNTSKGIFGSQSRAEDAVILNDVGQEVIKLVGEIAKYNPTPMPMENWKNEEKGHECKLDGSWKLRFTTAADATFKPGKRGPATTVQRVNATKGTLTNIIEFRENNGTVRSFNVVVEGERETETFMSLAFKRIVVNREPRRWLARKLFSQLTFLLPDFSVLERFTRRKGEEKERRTNRPGFEILYLDDDLRIHNTTQGQLFVQSRLYDVWDPMKESGWTTVSAI